MRKGYLLAEAMIAIAIAGSVALVFTTMNYYTHIQSNVLKQQNTKIILEVVRSRLLNLAVDPDDDGYFELLKEVNATLPITIGLGTDAWGKRIYYYTFDEGLANLDPLYAQNTNAISPTVNVVGRLVSSGEDMRLDTTSTDATAQGDDLLLEIGIGELNHFKLYGGSEITTQTRGYNSAIVSNVAPASPIDGTLWYDTATSKLKIYDANASSWTNIN